MSKEDIAGSLIKSVYGDEYEKEKLYSYLIEDTEVEPNMKNLNFNYVYFNNIISNQIDEQPDVISRFLKILCKYNPDRLIDTTRTNSVDIYSIYKKANLPLSFVKNDFLKKIKLQIHYGYNSVLYNIESLFEKFELNYENVAQSIVEDINKSSVKTEDIILITELAYKEYINKSKNKYMFQFEKILLSIIKKEYRKEYLRVLMEYVKDREVLEYYKNTKTFNIVIQKYDIENLIVYIIKRFIDIDKNENIIYESLRILLILMDYELLMRFSNFNLISYLNMDNLKNFREKFNLPREMLIKFCNKSLIKWLNNPDVSVFYNELKRILDEDTEYYKKILYYFLDNKDEINSILTLVVLLKNDKLDEPQKYISDVENFIINHFKILYNGKSKNFIFSDYEKMKDFEFLRDKNYMPLKIEGLVCDEIMKSCIFLMDYSNVARNTIKICIGSLYTWALNNLNLISNYKLFSKEASKNIYDKFYYDFEFTFENLCYIYLLKYDFKEEEKIEFLEFLKNHKQEVQEKIENFKLENDFMVKLINLLYSSDNGFDYKYLAYSLKRNVKSIINCAEKLLQPLENETRVYVEELLASKKKQVRDSAMRLIRMWDNDKIEKELKNVNDIDALTEYITKMYIKSNENSVPFAEQVDYSKVRLKDSDNFVPEILIKYYISEYILLKEVYIIKACKIIEDFINIYDLRKLIKDIFDIWVSEGTSIKYKNLLIPFALTAGELQITELKNQIDFWANNGKPAMAAFAVEALCMNSSKLALSIVDSIAQKHKNKKVKTAAKEGLETAAKEMNITREELDDIIVPDLGFNNNRTRIFDYGQRKFKAVLNDKLEITLFDENGKQIKSLPKASKKYNDNEDIVKNCKEDLKAVKKQLKVVFESQKPRISKAIMSGRKWSIKNWRKLFIENPIMISFAIGLIWEELDTDGNIKNTFRYMEDGTFNTIDEEELQLSENSFISLLHPVDIDKEDVESWIEQLEDYEIIQPVNQLNIPVYELSDEETVEITKYKGKKVYGSTFKSIATKLNMSILYQDYAEIAGLFYNDEMGYVMYLHIKPFYSGDYNEITELGVLDFRRKDNDKEVIMLKDVPKKLISLGIMVGDAILEKAVESK